jgi:mannose/fructose/N-acetylgalactosamine-specific phosphotransferase system component IID
MEDVNTFRPVFYFLVMKVFYSATALAATYGILLLSILFLLFEVFNSSCSSSSSSWCTYVDYFTSSDFVSWIDSITWLAYLLGVILLLAFFQVVVFMDSIHRKLSSSALGDAYSSLSVIRRQNLAKTTELLDTIVLNDDDLELHNFP